MWQRGSKIRPQTFPSAEVGLKLSEQSQKFINPLQNLNSHLTNSGGDSKLETKIITHKLIGKPRRIGPLHIKEYRFDKVLINRDSKYEAWQEMPFSQFLYVISKGKRHWQQSIWITADDIRDLKNLLEDLEEHPPEDDEWSDDGG